MEVSQAVCRITNQLPRVHHRVDSLGWGSNDILPGKGRDRLRMVCHGGGCTRRRRGLRECWMDADLGDSDVLLADRVGVVVRMLCLEL